MAVTYRPEIDGLRAVAVLSVVLFHAGVGGAGFVGVDVFFVISGYLITALLVAEWNSDRSINLPAFYARRVRRILPAVTVVVTATLAASALLLAPAELTQVAHSASAAMLFVANVFFQFATGSYFDGRSEEMPLLHLWSLSVEEQFYLVWPALVLVFLRFRHERLRAAVLVLGLASLILAQLLVTTSPEAAFYQMPPRFWELAAGGFIATLPSRRLPDWILPVGLVLVLMACLHPFSTFPASGALPVVTGSAMVIAAIHGGARNSLLRARPVVAVGLISYSLYLWHWPLLALYRATSIGDGRLVVRLALCAVAIVLAAVTYRYVETPFRRNRARPIFTVLAGGVGAICLALGAWGMTVASTTRDEHPLATFAASDFPPRVCHSREDEVPVPKCLPRPSTRIAIWGDSMAYSWSPAAWKVDPNAVAFTRDACGPLLEALPSHPAKIMLDCREFNLGVERRLVGLKSLVLVSLWTMDENKFAGLANTLDAVAGKVDRVLVLGPTPTMRDDVPRCIRQDDAMACAISRAEFDRQAKPILARLRELAHRHANVKVVDLTDEFCTRESCGPLRDGVPLYWDSHHISMSAARQFRLPVSAPIGGAQAAE